jgi:pantothenate kinase type III
MLLLIDAGNTRIKWGVPQRMTALTNVLPDWLAMDSVAHTEIATLAERWHQYPVTRVLVSNVAGEGVKAQLNDILARIFPRCNHIGWRRKRSWPVCKTIIVIRSNWVVIVLSLRLRRIICIRNRI